MGQRPMFTLPRAACPVLCSERAQRARVPIPAAHDLAERFAAYTDQLPLAACRLTRHKQSANRAP